MNCRCISNSIAVKRFYVDRPINLFTYNWKLWHPFYQISIDKENQRIIQHVQLGKFGATAPEPLQTKSYIYVAPEMSIFSFNMNKLAIFPCLSSILPKIEASEFCILHHKEQSILPLAHVITYSFYRQDNVVLGGTYQKGEERLDKDQRYYDDIMARCCRLVPSLKHAEVERTWVGLRPWRSSVRLEVEMISVNGRRLPVSRKVAISSTIGQWNADLCHLSDDSDY